MFTQKEVEVEEALKVLWSAAVIAFLKNLVTAIEGLRESMRIMKRTRRLVQRTYTITELREDLESGELKLGDSVKVVGKYSEFPPFVNVAHFLTKSILLKKRNAPHEDLEDFQRIRKPSVPPFALPLRPDSVDNINCRALYLPDAERWTDCCVPIFWHNNSKVSWLANLCPTGDHLELECRIIPLKDEWRRLIVPNSAFTYAGPTITSTNTRFGLEILEASEHDLPEDFTVDLWRFDHVPFSENTLYISFTLGHPLSVPYYLLRDWSLQLSSSFYRNIERVLTWGIVPDVNVVLQDEYEEAKNLLRRYYSKTMEVFLEKTADPDYEHGRYSIPIKIGGRYKFVLVSRAMISRKTECSKTDFFTEAITDFQYDQVNPPLPQPEVDFRNIVQQILSGLI